MEFNHNDLENGVLNLSLSRPRRTDDQLIINYLNPGVIGWEPTPFIIFPTNMDKWTSPQDLCRLTLAERDSHRYFYVRRGILDAGENGNDMVGGRGYWELANEDVEDISFNDRKIGEKRKLIYFEANGSRSQWIMFEYKAIITDVPNYILHRAVYKLRNTGDLIFRDEGKAEMLSVGKVPNGTDDVDGKKAAEKLSDSEEEDELPVVRVGDTASTDICVEDDSDGDDKNEEYKDAF